MLNLEVLKMAVDAGVTVDNSGLDKVELKRTLGLFSGCTMILGTIIGSGIFVSPRGVLQETGSVGLALVVWGLAGVLVLFGALCYAELGTLIPKSGGAYAYIQEGFGDMPAFLFMWATAFIVLPTGNAVISLTFAQYVLQPFYPTCPTPQSTILILAALALLLLSFINGYSVIWAARIQGVFTVIKVLALVLIIITGIVVLAQGGYTNFADAFAESTTKPGKIAIAFYSGLFSYAGWDALNFLTEELKSPYKNLPRAILISLPLVTVIYVLANVAYFAVLGPDQVLDSDAVAVTFALKKYGVLAWIMPVLVAFSTFGSLNGCIMCVGRLFFVGARGGHLPDAMALINIHTFTPVPAVIVLAVISITMLFLGDVYTLINYVTFVESLCFAVCVCVLLYFRWRKPNVHRPIKVPIVIPVIFLIVCVFLLILPIYTSPQEVGMAIVLLLSGVPIYLIGIVWSNKPDVYKRNLAAFTKFVQKMTFSCEQEV